VLFPTATFAIFFMVVLPLSWLLMPRGERWRPFIIAASFVFYSAWDWRFVFLLAVSIVWNYVFALAIHRRSDPRGRKSLLVAAIAGNVAILGYFKYYDFFVSNARNALGHVGIDVSSAILSITLPIGISFFTFQALSYVIDIYRRQFEPVKLLDFAVYLSFFPHLIAGPIVRAAEFLPQLKERHDPRRIDASRAFFLIVIGLFKKVVIANFLATHIVDIVFATPNRQSSLTLLVGVYAYAVQIYADFSGYTDMAIGLALLIGFRFPQNFDGPYTATSLQDFWRRWHMTLSRWLRDYLYIPLGGNRGSSRQTYRNLMLTFVIGGLWHGAAWTFVVWGAIHGGFLSYEHWRRESRAERGLPDPADTVLRRTVQRIVIFQVVCFAWIFFRAESISNAWDVITGIFDPSRWGAPSPLVTGSVLLATAIGIGAQYVPRDVTGRVMAGLSRLSPVATGVLLGISLLVINTMGPRGVAPFIYFKF
jgi:D-alanyl-lipoteichoic acid acyltransferase DltB (MBOAT superfamily)